MIQIHITKASAHLCSPPEVLTAGMAKAVSVEFAFSSDWDGLTKTAVFTNGRATIDVLPAKWDGDTVTVPAEILAVAGRYARVGVYGTNASGVVLPTVWVSLGKVQSAVEPSGDPSTDHTLPVWAQLQEQIGNLADLKTDSKDNIVAAINEARSSGGSGGGFWKGMFWGSLLGGSSRNRWRTPPPPPGPRPGPRPGGPRPNPGPRPGSFGGGSRGGFSGGSRGGFGGGGSRGGFGGRK